MTTKTVLGRGRFLSLLDRDGWEFATRVNAHGVVAVVAITDDDELLITQQYRRPVNADVLELPAGLIGDTHGEDDAISAGQRELLEETGYVANHWQTLTLGPTSGGMTDELQTMVLATGLTRAGLGGGVGNESIQTFAVHLDEIDTWIAAQLNERLIIDAKVWAGAWWARRVLTGETKQN